ncbi:hypothetical protein [Demequina flava]|uniref:hypothetical protein n=1 Tax=Demequina flava TaxID=1095025 RepID=UPI000784AE8C|nr:hypothetical protein [Demequina flava]
MGWLDRFRKSRGEDAAEQGLSAEPPEMPSPPVPATRDTPAASGADDGGEHSDSPFLNLVLRGEQEEADRALETVQEAALVRGERYNVQIKYVKELKREGRLEEAERLALECLAATVREARAHRAVHGGTFDPGTGYANQVAIIYRKRGLPDVEASFLREQIALREREGWNIGELPQRLEKATALAEKKAQG